MRLFILSISFIFLSCTDVADVKPENYSFHLRWDFQDNVLYVGGKVVSNYDYLNKKAMNKYIYLIHDKDIIIIKSDKFKIDDIEILQMPFYYTLTKSHDSFIFYIPEVYTKILQYTEELKFQVHYSYEHDLYLDDY